MPSKKPSGKSGKKEKVSFRVGRKKISAELRSSGKAKKDFEKFLESEFKAGDAGRRSKESNKGIAEAVKWLEQADSALAVMDSPKDPKTPANVKIKGIRKQSKKRK